MVNQTLLARLHLHAVMPRLEELLKLDSEAKRLAESLGTLAIRFMVKDGPAVTLNFANGGMKADLTGDARSDVGLLFTSAEKLNKMFLGEKVVPIPYKGFLKLGKMKAFTELTERLTAYLKPSDSALSDPNFKRIHVNLMLLVGLSGAAVLAKHDPSMAKIAKKLPEGVLMFNVLPDGPAAHVVVERQYITVYDGPVDDPDSLLSIRDLDYALDVLQDKVDGMAALGSGDLRAYGLLPLADEYNALMEKVGLYLA
jgi:hypothetical protein